MNGGQKRETHACRAPKSITSFDEEKMPKMKKKVKNDKNQ